MAIILGNANAQEPKPGDYVPNPRNKKFEGTWTITGGNTHLQITFINKEKILIKGIDVFTDLLEGYITYIKNGDTIIKNSNIIKGGVCNPRININAFGAVFTDPKGRNGKVFANFENKEDLNTLTLNIIPYPNTKYFLNDKRPLRLPEKLILQRVK